jgi:hypothetical protein
MLGHLAVCKTTAVPQTNNFSAILQNVVRRHEKVNTDIPLHLRLC